MPVNEANAAVDAPQQRDTPAVGASKDAEADGRVLDDQLDETEEGAEQLLGPRCGVKSGPVPVQVLSQRPGRDGGHAVRLDTAPPARPRAGPGT